MPLLPADAEARSLRPFAITGEASSSNDVWLGPARCAMNRFCCASCGLIGVTLAGCSNCETSSSLTRAISCRGSRRSSRRRATGERRSSSGRRRSLARRRATRAGRSRARCARGRARRCASRCPRRAAATSRRSGRSPFLLRGRLQILQGFDGPIGCAGSAATSTAKESDRRDRNPWRGRAGWSSGRRGSRRRRPWPCSCASTGWPDRGRRRARAGAALQRGRRVGSTASASPSRGSGASGSSSTAASKALFGRGRIERPQVGEAEHDERGALRSEPSSVLAWRSRSRSRASSCASAISASRVDDDGVVGLDAPAPRAACARPRASRRSSARRATTRAARRPSSARAARASRQALARRRRGRARARASRALNESAVGVPRSDAQGGRRCRLRRPRCRAVARRAAARGRVEVGVGLLGAVGSWSGPGSGRSMIGG